MDSLSPYLQSSTNIYSYDVYGNFQGFSTPIIDLTLSDVEELTPKKAKRKPKKEPKVEVEEAVNQPTNENADILAHQTSPPATVQLEKTHQTPTVQPTCDLAHQTSPTSAVQSTEKSEQGSNRKYNLRSAHKNKQPDSNNAKQPLSTQSKESKESNKVAQKLCINSTECKEPTIMVPEKSVKKHKAPRPEAVTDQIVVNTKPRTPGSTKAKRKPRLSMKRSKKTAKPANTDVGGDKEKKVAEIDREEGVAADGWTNHQVTLLKR